MKDLLIKISDEDVRNFWINILKNKEYALKIVNRHVQIVSLFLLILSGCLTLNNRYELSALINTTNIFLHIGNFANHLKITEKRISALFIENTLYYLIFIHIFFYVYVNIFLIEFYLFYTLSLFGACIVLLLYNIILYISSALFFSIFSFFLK